MYPEETSLLPICHYIKLKCIYFLQIYPHMLKFTYKIYIFFLIDTRKIYQTLKKFTWALLLMLLTFRMFRPNITAFEAFVKITAMQVTLLQWTRITLLPYGIGLKKIFLSDQAFTFFWGGGMPVTFSVSKDLGSLGCACKDSQLAD